MAAPMDGGCAVIHIINDDAAGIDFDRYCRYIESVRHDLPDAIYRFAADSRHFDLHSPQTLHDAWLDSLTIREDASGDRDEVRRLAIDICLLGPFHDRRIHLRYRGVLAYRFDVPPDAAIRFTHTGHGDLITHEVRLRHGGGVIHELLFERRGTCLIECEDFSHAQEML